MISISDSHIQIKQELSKPNPQRNIVENTIAASAEEMTITLAFFFR